MKRIWEFVVLALAAWPATGHAEAGLGGYTMLGFGNDSCGRWTAIQDEEWRPVVYSNWVLGFVSAYNLYGPGSGNVSKGTDAYGLMSWMNSYCAQHPLDTVAQAAAALVIELKSRAAH